MKSGFGSSFRRRMRPSKMTILKEVGLLALAICTVSLGDRLSGYPPHCVIRCAAAH